MFKAIKNLYAWLKWFFTPRAPFDGQIIQSRKKVINKYPARPMTDYIDIPKVSQYKRPEPEPEPLRYSRDWLKQSEPDIPPIASFSWGDIDSSSYDTGNSDNSGGFDGFGGGDAGGGGSSDSW